MKETDELRRLLDECGIEHDDRFVSGKGLYYTEWKSGGLACVFGSKVDGTTWFDVCGISGARAAALALALEDGIAEGWES